MNDGEAKSLVSFCILFEFKSLVIEVLEHLVYLSLSVIFAEANFVRTESELLYEHLFC